MLQGGARGQYLGHHRFCLICWTNAITGILVPCDVKIYLIKCMWVSDLHFMVQRFCLLSWRLFDGLMLYGKYWFSVTQTLNWNYRCRSVTYISWSSDFVLYLEDYLMEILIQRDTNIELKLYTLYVGQWPIFHGPVILRYILQTIWWTNVIIGILDPYDTKINHIKCIQVSDLHFVVQWF